MGRPTRDLTPAQREHKNAHNREYARARWKTDPRVLTDGQKRAKQDRQRETRQWARVWRLWLVLLEQRGIVT